MDHLWETIKMGADFFFQNLMFWNLLFAVVIVFFQRRDPKTVWAWLLLLYFIPVLGFAFYLLLGQDMNKRKMFQVKEVEDRMSKAIRQQTYRIKHQDPMRLNEDISNYKDLIMYNLGSAGAVLTYDNDVTIYTEGDAKFDALIEDIGKAEKFVHIQYYIIRDDILFYRIREVLEEKAAQGVEVRILFDAMGCRGVKKEFWKKLKERGIGTAEFFPAIWGRFQLRMNYRNHRKIVVIDNKVAYVGGFNIGKEYIGMDSKFGHWRDTHLRICGSAVLNLQMRFVLDWNYAAGEELLQHTVLFEGAEAGKRDFCKMQIISSGPDNTTRQIRDNYLRLIHKAQKRICIQTPYFIPDEAILSALLIAVRSGIEVNIMVPCKPDHPFVYWATYSYVGDMVKAGANCYIYMDGFLHAKGVVVDGEVFCCGTANMDNRSFALNFEVNAIVYDRIKAQEMEEIFRADLKACTQITRDAYAGRPLKIRMKEQICRLLSPLL